MYTKNLFLDFVDTGVAEAEVNMSLDAGFLADLNPDGIPILHCYDWALPSFTYGHFIDLKEHLDLGAVEKHGLVGARRSTGGGIVFHIWDFAFSFLMPSKHPACSENTLENYQFVNQVVLEAVQGCFQLQGALIPEPAPPLGPNCTHFCMARPTIYDVVHEGQKIAGAAQRRTKKGYLHQGTISLALPDFSLLKSVLLSHEELIQAMMNYTFAVTSKENLEKARHMLKERLLQKLVAKLQGFSV